MKKILIFTIIAIATFSFNCSEQSNNFKAQEIFIRLDPMNQYLEIIEYNIVTTLHNETKIIDIVKELQDLIKKAKYSQNKYNFKYFIPIEEKLTNEKEFIKGTYYLLTKEKNIKNLLKDTFESIIDRDVTVSLTEKEIGIGFNGKGINIGTNNSLGVYAKEDQRMVYWKNGTQTFEIVFNFDTNNLIPLTNYVKKNTLSPELTREQIGEIKFGSPELEKSLQGFQDDADIYRLRHIKYYGYLIEEYYKKAKHYPFEGKEKLPVYVYIAQDEQEQYTKGENPYPHKVYKLSDFIHELENILGYKIKQYYDPQYAPDKKPNFYMYMIRDDQYFFAIHTSRYNNFTTKVNDNYYKVEISNKKIKGTNILLYEELINNKKFNELINLQPSKEDFFLEREEKYLYFIK